MKPRLMVFVVGLSASLACAQSSTWNSDAGGNWSDTARWAGGIVANGASSTGNFATINITAARSVTVDVNRTIGHLLFCDIGGGGTHDWTLAGAPGTVLTLAVTSGVPTIWVTNRILNLSSEITGTGGFRKYGNGAFVILSTNSSMTGPVTIEGSYHYANTELAWGAVPAVFTPNALTFNNVSVGNNAGTIVISTNRGVTLAGPTYFRVQSSRNTVIHSPITGPSLLGVAYDGGYLVLMNQLNNYAGNTVIGAAQNPWTGATSAAGLQLGNDEVIPHGFNRGDLVITNNPTATAGQYVTRLDLHGFTETVNGLFGTGFVTNNVATPSTLRVGAGNANGLFTGTIDDGVNGDISIVKTGGGLQNLLGTNLYSGSTTVEGGVLGIGGAAALAGSLTVMPGATLSPGRPDAMDTLTVNGPMAVSNATMILNLGSATTAGAGVNDLLAAASVDLGGANTVQVVPLQPLVTGSPYTVITYTGVTGAGSLTASAPGTRYTVALDLSTPGLVQLTASGAPSNLTWTSKAGWKWDLTNTPNWVGGPSAETFHTVDAVTLDDTSVQQTLQQVGQLLPASVTVNASTNYFLTGFGSIGGAASLTKDGSGYLLVSSTNDYTGGTRIEGGIAGMTHVNALGPENSPLVITNGGTFDVRGLQIQYKPVFVSGGGVSSTGAIINTGGAQNNALRMVTLQGDTIFGGFNRWDIRSTAGAGYLSTEGNNYNLIKTGPNQMALVSLTIDPALGDIEVREGIFAFEGNNTGMGSTAHRLTVWSNAWFQMWSTTNVIDKPITMFGGSRFWTGSGNEGNDRIGSTVILTNGLVMVDLDGANQWSLYGTVEGNGGLRTIDTGTLRISGTNTFTGATVAGAGTIVLQTNAWLNGTAAISTMGSGRMYLDKFRYNNPDMIADGTPYAPAGGTFYLQGADAATSTETLGAMTLLGGPTTITVQNGTNTASSALFFGGFAREQGVVNFTYAGDGTLGAGSTNSADPHVYFAGLADGFLPWATVNGTNFAQYSSENGVSMATPPTTEFNGAANQAGVHVRYTPARGGAEDLLYDNRSVASMTVTPGANNSIELWDKTLTITTGGFLLNGNNPFAILAGAGGTITGSNPIFNVASASGVLTNYAAITGDNVFSKEGAGRMVQLADNSNSGGTRIGGGILQLGDGGTAGNVGAGDVVNYGTLMFHRSDHLVFTNHIVGDGGLVKTNQNTLTLTGANSYTGATLIGSGVVSVERITDGADSQLGVTRPMLPDLSYLQIMDGTLQVTGSSTSMTARRVFFDRGTGVTIDVANASGVLEFDGQVTGGTPNAYKRGDGTLVLGGTVDNNGSKFVVDAGTLILTKASSPNVHALGSGLTLNNGLVQLAGTGGDQIYYGLTAQINGGTFDLNGRTEGFNGLNGLGGTILNNAAGTTSELIVGQNNAGGTYAGLLADGAGTLAFSKAGTGAMVLSNAVNTYSGGTVISNGVLRVLNGGSLGAVPAAPDAGNVTMYGGILMNQDSDAVIEANRGIRILGTNAGFQAGWSKTLTINSVISGIGGVEIRGDGGRVIFSGANTYIGDTWLSAKNSMLTLGASEVIPDGAGRGNVILRGTLNLNGFNETINGLTGSYSNRIVNTTGSSTLTIGANDADAREWSGLIVEQGGAIALRKTGAGTAILQAAGTNTLSGGVTVDGGVLALDSAPNSTVTVNAGGTAGLVNRFGATQVNPGSTLRLGATKGDSLITAAGGLIQFTAAGLYEGRLAAAWNTTTANPEADVRLGTAYAQTGNTTEYPNNSTYVYTGFVNNPDPTNVTWSFAKQFDDYLMLRIDGNTLISNSVWNIVVVTNYTLTPGYHTFEVRVGQGGGGVGPNLAGWFTGFGYDPAGVDATNGYNYHMMADPGDGSMFVVSTSAYTVGNALNVSADTRFDLAGLATPTVTGAVSLAAQAEFTGAPGRSVNFTGAMTLGGPSTLNVSSGGVTVVLGAPVGGAQPLTKAGPGTLVMTASNTYSGMTRVSGGSLVLTGDGALESPTIQIDGGARLVASNLNAGTMRLRSGQTLQGGGTLSGGLITDPGAVLAPGSNGTAVLTVGDSLQMDAGSALDLQLNGLVAGAQFDQLALAAGTLALNGPGLNITLGFAPNAGDSFAIVTGLTGFDPGVNGTFDSKPDGSVFTAGSTQLQIDYNETDITLTVVPEPGALAAFGLLLLAAALRRRKAP